MRDTTGITASSYGTMPSFMMSHQGVLIWATEEGRQWLDRQEVQTNVKALFFEKDFDKIRQDAIAEPYLCLVKSKRPSNEQFLLTPFPDKTIFVQVLKDQQNAVEEAMNARIRDELQKITPALSYLYTKERKTEKEASFDDDMTIEAMNVITRGFLQIEQVLFLKQYLEQTIEAGKTEQSVDVTGLLGELAPAVYTVVSYLNRDFQWEIPPFGVWVPGDEKLLSTVVLSLLSNAFENTEEGDKILLKLSVSNQIVRIRVQDTGKGIPSDKRDDIFSPVYFPEGRKYAPELNLGLPVSQKIIRELGGTLIIYSEEGQGTSIEVALPRKKCRSKYAKFSADNSGLFDGQPIHCL